MNDEYNRVNIGHISTKVFPFSLVKIPVAEGRGGISTPSLKSTSPNLTKQEETQATWVWQGWGAWGDWVMWRERRRYH